MLAKSVPLVIARSFLQSLQSEAERARLAGAHTHQPPQQAGQTAAPAVSAQRMLRKWFLHPHQTCGRLAEDQGLCFDEEEVLDLGAERAARHIERPN